MHSMATTRVHLSKFGQLGGVESSLPKYLQPDCRQAGLAQNTEFTSLTANQSGRIPILAMRYV